MRLHASAFTAIAVAALVGTAAPVDAQLAHASSTSLGMAGNNTAFVRGFGAISVNPAGIGMPGSGFSLAVGPVSGRAGLSPITLGDLVDYEGVVVPASVRSEWLERVSASGGESGMLGAEVTALALTLGNMGFQFSTTAGADVNLPPGVVEAMLFGNAGRTGDPVDLSLTNAGVEAYAMSTAGVSFALPINPALVVGMTGKFTFGHALAVGRSTSGSLSADPISATVDFPLITSCVDEVVCTQDPMGGGSGFGLDLGAMMDLGQITVGASLQNIISNFAWDETTLGYRPGTVVVDVGTAEAEYEEFPFDQAPAELRALIDDFTLKPSVRLGAAMELTPLLTVTGDIHGRLADEGIALQPNYSTGVGAQLDLGLLQLRGGITKISDAMQYGGGTTLVVGPVNLSLAGGLIRGDLADTGLFQFGLSFGDR